MEAWLGRGVRRVVLGTAAVRDPAFVKAAARKFPEQVAVGIDARDGRVAVEGWAATSDLEVTALARRFEDSGVCALIHTDIARDGMLSGLNLEATLGARRGGGDSGHRVGRPLLDGRYRAPR